MSSPIRTAEAFGVEEIIDPASTRQRLCEFAQHAYRVLEARPHTWGFRG
jgi:hypothetical protein